MQILPEKKNTLNGFDVDYAFPAQIKDRVNQFIDEHVLPNNLHLVRGLHGDEYGNSDRHAAVSIGSGLALSAVTAPLALLTAAAIKIEHPDLPVLYHGHADNPRVQRIRRTKDSLLVRNNVQEQIQEAPSRDRQLQLAAEGQPVEDRHGYLEITEGYKVKRLRMSKFRTMLAGADEFFKPGEKAEDTCADAITITGKILRSTKLDEQPQLWNIALHQLDIFGTRPMILNELTGDHIKRAVGFSEEALANYHDEYNAIKKSPFGFVDIVGVGHELTSQKSFEDRIAADLVYRRIQSAKVDSYGLRCVVRNMLVGS